MNFRRFHYITLAAAALVATCIVLVSTNAQSQGGGASQPAPQTTPPWAYPISPPAPPPQEDGTQHRVPGSTLALTITQDRDTFNIPDWHPDGHPPLPDAVAHGRKPDVWGCGYCHLPNGQGRPENAGLAGLPAGYIAQQVTDWKGDLRKSSEPRMGPPGRMLGIAKAANDAEVKAAAEYFSSMKFKSWIRVIETETVPKSTPEGGMMVPVRGGSTEPIGQRIIEMPENVERTELRDDASGFVAYVPVGSIKKGEALVTTGGAGKTIRCSICHGPDLKEIGRASCRERV